MKTTYWETFCVVEVKSIVEDFFLLIGYACHVQVDEGAIYAIDHERECLVYSSNRVDVCLDSGFRQVSHRYLFPTMEVEVILRILDHDVD